MVSTKLMCLMFWWWIWVEELWTCLCWTRWEGCSSHEPWQVRKVLFFLKEWEARCTWSHCWRDFLKHTSHVTEGFPNAFSTKFHAKLGLFKIFLSCLSKLKILTDHWLVHPCLVFGASSIEQGLGMHRLLTQKFGIGVWMIYPWAQSSGSNVWSGCSEETAVLQHTALKSSARCCLCCLQQARSDVSCCCCSVQ